MRYGIALLLLPMLVHARFSNFEAVPAPQHVPVSLMDAISEDGSVKYSDEDSRLTSVKDNNFKACFITDLDPEWSLDLNEKQSLIDTHEPEIVRSPLQYENLKLRTGDMIALMCKKSKIYWLTETHSQPLQSGGRSLDHRELPPPVRHPIAPAHQPQVQHLPRPVHVVSHTPAHIPHQVHAQSVPQQVPSHMGTSQHAPAHVSAPQLAPVHIGTPQHVPARVEVPQRAPAPQHVPQAQPIPGHAAFHAAAPIQVAAPHHAVEHIPKPFGFRDPVAPVHHRPEPMLVPRHLPFIRPHAPAPARVPEKRQNSQSSQDRPMAVPERLSMARPQLKPHH